MHAVSDRNAKRSNMHQFTSQIAAAPSNRPTGFLNSETPARSFSVQSKSATLTINEIYRSIQGESTWAGLPCIFVRLTFCDLRCSYCDTAYAFYSGNKMTVPEIDRAGFGP